MSLSSKSKFLSYVLRHRPDEFGLTLSDGGWVSIDKLLEAINKGNQKITREELEQIVATDNKKRYSFDGNGNIRANQGHSVEVDLKLEEKEPPEWLYHGTGEKYVSSTQQNGIKKMNRHHVHLSADKETAKKVGQRHGKAAIITIRAKDMYKSGIKFYQSENGVWLTDFVDPVWFLFGERLL